MTRFAAGIFLVSFALAACVVQHTPGTSFVTPALPNEEAIQRIAIDATACLEALYPPGLTTIRLMTPTEKDGFSRLLEDRLRTSGFTVVGSSNDSAAIQVEYILDQLKPEPSHSLLLRLHLVDSTSGSERKLMRSYNMAG
ncbi:hypothetical protein JZU56_05075, partial [bacterium]|nr:hypothetical protein [bacterium]